MQRRGGKQEPRTQLKERTPRCPSPPGAHAASSKKARHFQGPAGPSVHPPHSPRNRPSDHWLILLPSPPLPGWSPISLQISLHYYSFQISSLSILGVRWWWFFRSSVLFPFLFTRTAVSSSLPLSSPSRLNPNWVGLEEQPNWGLIRGGGLALTSPGSLASSPLPFLGLAKAHPPTAAAGWWRVD